MREKRPGSTEEGYRRDKVGTKKYHLNLIKTKEARKWQF